ncbi:FUSC family protein, partial [Phaeobacter sp. HF9A]|uniref:FUSC family protein n=1 Tax=Phaeobacter sp. HF9A TaxID=2721561 RepID=UPI00142FD4FA
MASNTTSSTLALRLRRIGDHLIEGAPAPMRLALATTLAAFAPAIATAFLAPHLTAVPFLGALATITGIRGSGFRVASLALLVGGGAVILVQLFSDWAPMLAALLALAAAIFGRFGHARPMMVVCVTWSVFTGQIIPTNEPALVLACYWGGALFAMAVAWLSHAAYSFTAEGDRSHAHALVLGVLFASGFAFATWFGRHYFSELGAHGYFFPLAFAFLCLPPHSQFFGNTIKRCIGTVLGWLVSIGLLALSLPTWASIVLGLSCYVMFQWLISWSKLVSMAVMTIAIILLIGVFAPGQPIATERLDAVLAAAAMAFVLAFVAVVVLRAISPKALA